MKNFYSIEIINRLKTVLNVKSDVDLNNKMKLSNNTIGIWKHRNTIDFPALITFCNENNININFIVYGEGEPFLLSNEKLKEKIERLEAEKKELFELIKKNEADIQKYTKNNTAYDSDYHKLVIENYTLLEKVELLKDIIIKSSAIRGS